MFVHLFVDGFPGAVALGGDGRRQAQHRVAVGREGDRRTAIRLLDLGGHTGQHGDRELKTLRAMDGHDPHTVVVGLRQHRFRHPGIVGALKAGPTEVGPQIDTASIDPGPSLIDHEAQPPPHIARVAAGDRGLKHTPLSDESIEKFGRGRPETSLVKLLEMLQTEGDRMGLLSLGNRCSKREPATHAEAPVGEVIVAAAVDERAERGDGGEFVGRVGDGGQGEQDLADLARCVDERRGLSAVRHAHCGECRLERRQACA